MRDDDREHLTPSLEKAASLLRDEPVVRAEWRNALLERVASEVAGASGANEPDVVPIAMRRRWSVSPFAAVAAGLVCAALGASLTFMAMHRTNSRAASLVATESGRGPDLTPVSNDASPRIRFAVVAPNAAHVSIVGDFNRWNPTSLPMQRSADGRTWEVEVPLAPGRYTYAFLVDGRIARDSAAAETTNDGFGSSNSVVLVKGS